MSSSSLVGIKAASAAPGGWPVSAVRPAVLGLVYNAAWKATVLVEEVETSGRAAEIDGPGMAELLGRSSSGTTEGCSVTEEMPASDVRTGNGSGVSSDTGAGSGVVAVVEFNGKSPIWVSACGKSGMDVSISSAAEERTTTSSRAYTPLFAVRRTLAACRSVSKSCNENRFRVTIFFAVCTGGSRWKAQHAERRRGNKGGKHVKHNST